MDIGNQLSRLGVDICEAGFPIASQGDFDAVSEVAKTAGQATEGRHGGVPMRIAGLSRANKKVRPNPNPTNPNPNPRCATLGQPRHTRDQLAHWCDRCEHRWLLVWRRRLMWGWSRG